ncbi:unnamed protein product [Linum trigynum]|uniref:Uncharacterized protein n=1 Tax=Linum trigynum TaxID=586398 RepID=A0AAV2EVU5_9ROSI
MDAEYATYMLRSQYGETMDLEGLKECAKFVDHGEEEYHLNANTLDVRVGEEIGEHGEEDQHEANREEDEFIAQSLGEEGKRHCQEYAMDKESYSKLDQSFFQAIKTMTKHLEPIPEEKDDQPIKEPKEEDHKETNEIIDEDDDLTTSKEEEDEIPPLEVALN